MAGISQGSHVKQEKLPDTSQQKPKSREKGEDIKGHTRQTEEQLAEG